MSDNNDMNEQKTGGFMSRFTKRPELKELVTSVYGNGEQAQDSPREELGRDSDKSYSVTSASSREVSPQGREMNVFTEGLTIEGNVISETGIIIRGTVNGSVACRADVEISGEITGDVQGKNVRITGGGVQGDITAGEMLSIDHSQIKGNLSATHARINTPIEGDVSVRGTLTLQREANIQGNITAAGLSVEEGASMNGRITISRERPENSYAPQASRSVSTASKRPAAKAAPSPKPAPATEGSSALGVTAPVAAKPAEEKAADKHLPLTEGDKLFTAEP